MKTSERLPPPCEGGGWVGAWLFKLNPHPNPPPGRGGNSLVMQKERSMFFLILEFLKF